MWCAIALCLLGVMTWIKTAPGSVPFILTVVGVVRVVEIVVYQVNVVLFHEWRSKRQHQSTPYAVRSYRRLVVLTIHNYVEILLWFAMFYVRAARCFHTACDGLSLETMSGAGYHSMLTMTTLGYGDIYPLRGEWVAALLAVAQTMIGVFLSVVVLARVIALIPRPLSMDENEGV